MNLYFLVFQQEGSEIGLGGNQLLTLGVGLLFTALAATYVTRLAKVTLIISCYNTMLILNLVYFDTCIFLHLCNERSDLYFMIDRL